MILRLYNCPVSDYDSNKLSRNLILTDERNMICGRIICYL